MAQINLKDLQNKATSGTNPINDSTSSSTGVGINTEATTNLSNTYYNALYTLLYVASIAAVLTFIYAGVRYITAGGEADKAESAKKIMLGSIIGIIIIIAAFTFYRTTINVVNSPAGSNATSTLNQK